MGSQTVRYDGCFHHKSLASFVEAFAAAGLTIHAVRESSKDGHAVLPWDIAVVTGKDR